MRTNNPYTVENIVALTKSDTLDVAVTNGLRVETTGAVKMTLFGGGTVTLTLVASVDYPYRVKRVWSTGTDAITVHGLY